MHRETACHYVYISPREGSKKKTPPNGLMILKWSLLTQAEKPPVETLLHYNQTCQISAMECDLSGI